jgi:hypothetical protein
MNTLQSCVSERLKTRLKEVRSQSIVGRCKASNQAVIRGMDRGKQRGYPYQMHDKTEHPREARKSPAGHPRDAPRRIEAQKGVKVDARHRIKRSSEGWTEESKGGTLTKGGQKTEHPREARGSMQGIGPGGHPRDAPKQIEVKELPLPRHGGLMPGIEPNGHPRDEPTGMNPPLPKHGKRLFIQASLFWQNEYGKNRQCQGKFLVDSGCTGPYSILSSLWLTSCPGCVGKRLCRSETPMVPLSRMQGPSTRLH